MNDQQPWQRRRNGYVEIDEIPSSDWVPSASDSSIAAKFRYSWHPPYQIGCRLPASFSLQLECSLDKTGQRRFAPMPTTDAFLPWAGLAGQLLLDDRGEVAPRPILFIASPSDATARLTGRACVRRSYSWDCTRFGPKAIALTQ